MKKFFFVLGLTLGVNLPHCWSQISPPGLGKANSAGWFAVGVRQELDTLDGRGWQSMTYVGLGRKSNPDNDNLLYKPALFVVNQEFYHQFHKHWQYSFALSYRKQEEYLDKAPYVHASPNTQQEFRAYGRLSYIFKTRRLKFVPTFRQEFRKFATPDFKNTDENFQLRSRLRLQLALNLDIEKRHRLIASTEYLFSISKETESKKWTNFNYKENRFSLYYSLSPLKSPFIFNLGYMHNLVGTSNPYAVHYLAFDIIIENPFKLHKRVKEKIEENLE